MDNTVDNSSLDSSSIDDNSSKDNNSYVSEIIDIEEPFSQISISMLEIVLEESLNKKTAINGIVFTDESAEEINGTANSNQSVKHIEMTLGDSETIKEAISLLIEWEKAGKTPEDEELLKLPLKLIATYQVNIVEKLYPIVLLMSNSNKTQATQNLDRLLKNISTTDNKSGWTFTYTTDDNNKFVFIATYTG